MDRGGAAIGRNGEWATRRRGAPVDFVDGGGPSGQSGRPNREGSPVLRPLGPLSPLPSTVVALLSSFR